MRRVALLIGAQTGGLTGVGNDVDTMDGRLGWYGFTTTRREAGEATRDGILDAYEGLIRDTRAGDAVVVYFSGHGGLAVPPPGVGERAGLQFLVPTDYGETAGSRFLGITAAELSVLLVRLTHATANVTVILDACHAAHQSRVGDLRVKALDRPVYLDVAEHLSRLRREGLDTTVRDVLGNRNAVRVVACGREQSAYEHTDAGRRTGLLTGSLDRALAELGDRPATWAAVLARVRELTRVVMPAQRPEAEGPAHRLLFRSTAVEPAPGPIRPALGAPVTVEWGRVIDGHAHPLPMAGAELSPGDHVYVRVRNDGDRTVHVSVLEFDASHRITVITALDPSGVPLGPGRQYVAGDDDRLVGFPVNRPGSGEFVIVVASAPDPPVRVYRDLPTAAHIIRHDVHRIAFR